MKMGSSWTFLMFVNIFLLLSNLGPAAGFCPSGCECEELRLKVSCSNSTLDVLPIALNTRIEHIRMNFNKIRIVDASFQVGDVAVIYIKINTKTLLYFICMIYICFQFYEHLITIDLSSNIIEDIEDKSFAAQKSLIKLSLANNKLSDLSTKVDNYFDSENPYYDYLRLLKY